MKNVYLTLALVLMSQMSFAGKESLKAECAAANGGYDKQAKVKDSGKGSSTSTKTAKGNN